MTYLQSLRFLAPENSLLAPADEAAGARPAGLHAGAAPKTIIRLCQSFLVILMLLASPSPAATITVMEMMPQAMPEHRQHGAPLVRPQLFQRVSQVSLE